MSLAERLDQIRSRELQSQYQKETAVVLSAVEDTLRDHHQASAPNDDSNNDDHKGTPTSTTTPTAYFAALLALANQAISPSAGIVNKQLATSVVYLLEIVAPFVPPPLLRSRFPQILAALGPALLAQQQHQNQQQHQQHDAAAEAPLLRHALGCLETLLVVQDSASWALPAHTATAVTAAATAKGDAVSKASPRGAVAGILALCVDHRPKVRKRAQEALAKVLRNPPPSPSLDHPAADMCAEAALRSLREAARPSSSSTGNSGGKQKFRNQHHRGASGTTAGAGAGDEHHPRLMHALQLVKTIASAASSGWPARKIDALCELLLDIISRSSNEYLATASLEIFETVFAGMAGDGAGSGGASLVKLPRLLAAIADLKPSPSDARLLPPWIAVLARGYDVSAQVDPAGTLPRLPDAFDMVAAYLASALPNVRASAAQCLVSFVATCIPDVDGSDDDDGDDRKVLERICATAAGLLSVRYQAAWPEALEVFAALFDTLGRRATPLLDEAVRTVGDLRASESFDGKPQTDALLGKAVQAIGPEAVLRILPLNLDPPSSSSSKANKSQQKQQQQQSSQGRAWLLPILRDNIINTNLAHFRREMVPLSEAAHARSLDERAAGRALQAKIFDTVVAQVWSLLPGYCTLPLDLRAAFDTPFAELLSTLLYRQTDLRVDICRALRLLVDTNREALALMEEERERMVEEEGKEGQDEWKEKEKEHEGKEEDRDGDEGRDALARVLRKGFSSLDAQANLDHLATFAPNLLAVLFNVYSQTLPHHRGNILQCINSYLGITLEKELVETFGRVSAMLEPLLHEAAAQPKPPKQQDQNNHQNKMPPTSHALMDLVITISIHLPRSSYASLFSLAALALPLSSDPQLQKKAYKLLPRLATSAAGTEALKERNVELQALLLQTAGSVSTPARRDRLDAISAVTAHLPPDCLHFVPSVLPEVVLAAKETNAKAREAAFDLLVLMGNRMGEEGGTVAQSRIPNMPPDAPDTPASLEEFFTALSAGLAGQTPHAVAATVTALSRALYEFRARLPEPLLAELASTVDLFLTSRDREIARSVLGFVKVAALGLPEALVRPRLPELVLRLLAWAREHRNRLRSKVRGILERLVRRFGADLIVSLCPEEDRKLVQSIRKARDRAKRKKKQQQQQQQQQRSESKGEGEDEEGDYDDDGDDDGGHRSNLGGSRRRYESEYERALYESTSEDDSESGLDGDEREEEGQEANGSNGDGRAKVRFAPLPKNKDRDKNKNKNHHGHQNGTGRGTEEGGRPRAGGGKRRAAGGAYIVEDADEPLDLLDRRALGSISTTKPPPVRFRDLLPPSSSSPYRHKGRVSADGKLIIGADGDDNDLPMKGADNNNDGSGAGGIGAYVDAISGRDAATRGRGGRLKFSNRRNLPDNDDGDDGDAMDVDGRGDDATAGGNANGNNGVVSGATGRRNGTSNATNTNTTTRSGHSKKRFNDDHNRKGLGAARGSGASSSPSPGRHGKGGIVKRRGGGIAGGGGGSGRGVVTGGRKRRTK